MSYKTKVQVVNLVMIVLAFVAVVWVGFRLHENSVDRAVAKATRSLKTEYRESLEWEIVKIRESRKLDGGRYDVDVIIHGISRMRILDELRSLARRSDLNLDNDFVFELIEEAKFTASYVYRYADRKTFLAFGDTLHYVYLTPEKAGLAPEYWEALAKVSR